MKITGYKLRAALQRWQLRRDAAAGQFKDSLLAFEGDDKTGPMELSDTILNAEMATAELQTWQSRYNLLVTVTVGEGDKSRRMPLAQAVKEHGGIERSFKRWVGASKIQKDRYAHITPTTRDKDATVSRRTISYAEATTLAAAEAERRQRYTEAIAGGNAAEVELDNFPPALLE